MKLVLGFFTLFVLVSCKTHEARYPVSQNSGSYIDESIARNKKLVAQEEATIQKLIQEDSAHNYKSSTNGFWYYYNTKVADSISQITPDTGDEVIFDYSLSNLKGQAIYAEGEIPTQHYTVDKEKLFSGLRNGIKLMKEGETVTFLFPSHKAYGYYGDKNKIGTNVPLIARVNLTSIKKQNDTTSTINK